MQRALVKEITMFNFEGNDDVQMFGLLVKDLTQIKPNYEAMVKGGSLRITDDGYAQGKRIFEKKEKECGIRSDKISYDLILMILGVILLPLKPAPGNFFSDIFSLLFLFSVHFYLKCKFCLFEYILPCLIRGIKSGKIVIS